MRFWNRAPRGLQLHGPRLGLMAVMGVMAVGLGRGITQPAERPVRSVAVKATTLAELPPGDRYLFAWPIPYYIVAGDPESLNNLLASCATAFRMVPLSMAWAANYDGLIEAAGAACIKANAARRGNGSDAIPEAGIVLNFSPWYHEYKIEIGKAPDGAPVYEILPPTNRELEQAHLDYVAERAAATLAKVPTGVRVIAVLLDNEIWKVNRSADAVNVLDEWNAHIVVKQAKLMAVLRDHFGDPADGGATVSWYGFGRTPDGDRMHSKLTGLEETDSTAPVDYRMEVAGRWGPPFSERLQMLIGTEADHPELDFQTWITVNANSGDGPYRFNVDLQPYSLWRLGDQCRRRGITPTIYPGPLDVRTPQWESDAIWVWRGLNGHPMPELAKIADYGLRSADYQRDRLLNPKSATRDPQSAIPQPLRPFAKERTR